MSELFAPASPPAAPVPYRVLARKYRPQHLDDLRGQEALVRTLKNAITSGRLAQAYMLTGVRGVGKTTTARIIAKAINYTGPDGKSGPTVGPTDDCPVATAIAEGRCPDVVEMDAASHTGVDDMRDIIDGVRYAPGMARYKVYIIDEVHMLSKQAFNALLKTLEEPPSHVKFIFATTEIRKVPVTILSRCQRFDLRRFDDAELQKLLADICTKEDITADTEALALIARAGAGSARDGLSILDQAIALGDGTVQAEVVADMLGLMDQNRIVDVLSAALTGQIPEALAILRDLDQRGGDPLVMIEDLLSTTHRLMRARVTQQDHDLTETARRLGVGLTLPILSRAWQILLKSYHDVQSAPHPLAAAEMAIIRLGYAATLPDPQKLIRQLSEGGGVGANTPPSPRGGGQGGDQSVAVQAEPVLARVAAPQTLAQVVAILEDHGQMMVATTLAHQAVLIRLEPGRLELSLRPGANPRLAGDVGAALTQILGARWIVSIGSGPGHGMTVAEERAAAAAAKQQAILDDPMVRAVILAFPGAKLVE